MTSSAHKRSSSLKSGCAMEAAQTCVESFLAGSACSAHATPIVEEVLFNHALKHTVVYAGRAIKELLEWQGLSVTLQYCESPTHGHPVPFIIARDASGAFVIPSELEILSAVSSVDVVVVDGTTRLTRIASRRPHLKVYESANKRLPKLALKRGKNSKSSTSNFSEQPAAIVVMPATHCNGGGL